MALIEDYSPIFCGDTGAPFAPVFQTLDENGKTIAYDLTGTSISTIAVDADGTIKTWNGTWTTDDAVNGRAHYNYQSVDVDTAGIWKVYTILTKNGKPLHAQMKLLQINEM